MVGPNGFEPATSRLSGVRSNQLSYGPFKKCLNSLHQKMNLSKNFFNYFFNFPYQTKQALSVYLSISTCVSIPLSIRLANE